MSKCESAFCYGDTCFALTLVDHDSRTDGTITPGGDQSTSGPYFTEGNWNTKTRFIQSVANKNKCADPEAVRQALVAETAAKRSRGEIT